MKRPPAPFRGNDPRPLFSVTRRNEKTTPGPFFLVVLLVLLGAGRVGAHPEKLSYRGIAGRSEHVGGVAALARRYGVTFGIWGGTVRDIYLRHPFTVISDFDVIVDSSEQGFPAFRDALLEYNQRHSSSMPRVDFHYDVAQETERQLYFHRTGITATKVGLFPDGRILDPTGLGVRDLEDRFFRFHSPDPEPRIALQDVGRFTRDLARLISFRKDPATIRLLRSTLEQAGGRDLERAMRALRRQATEHDRVTFRRVMPIARLDHLHLHHDRHAELGPTFPLGMFVLELFKTVTQAPDEAAYHEAFRLVGVDAFLRRLGATEEARLLMDPELQKQDLFEAFAFPGSRSARDFRLTPAEIRRIAGTWVEYAGAFRHLERRLPPGSAARTHVGRQLRGQLAPPSFVLFAPGLDVAFHTGTFLDTSFSIGLLDEKWTRSTLEKWSREYRRRQERRRESPGAALELAGIDDADGRRGLQDLLDFLRGREGAR